MKTKGSRFQLHSNISGWKFNLANFSSLWLAKMLEIRLCLFCRTFGLSDFRIPSGTFSHISVNQKDRFEFNDNAQAY